MSVLWFMINYRIKLEELENLFNGGLKQIDFFKFF